MNEHHALHWLNHLEPCQKLGTLDLADIFTIFIAVDEFTRTNKTGPNNHPAYLWVREALDPMVHALQGAQEVK